MLSVTCSQMRLTDSHSLWVFRILYLCSYMCPFTAASVNHTSFEIQTCCSLDQIPEQTRRLSSVLAKWIIWIFSSDLLIPLYEFKLLIRTFLRDISLFLILSIAGWLYLLIFLCCIVVPLVKCASLFGIIALPILFTKLIMAYHWHASSATVLFHP